MKKLFSSVLIFCSFTLLAGCGIADFSPINRLVHTIEKLEAATSSSEEDNSAKNEEFEKIKTEADQLRERIKEQKRARIEEPSSEWNLSDTNPHTNGNGYVAIKYMEESGPLKDGKHVDIAKVFKAPWDYYGEPIAFEGYVQVVQDYPPDDNNYAKSEIALITEEGKIISVIATVPSGDIYENDYLSLIGMVIGRMEVTNGYGGTPSHLIVMTNHLK